MLLESRWMTITALRALYASPYQHALSEVAPATALGGRRTGLQTMATDTVLCHTPQALAARWSHEPGSRKFLTKPRFLPYHGPRSNEADTGVGIQFLQRNRVIAFYRTIIRGVYKIKDPRTRAESVKYARDEFERHRHVTDIVRTLIAVAFLHRPALTLTLAFQQAHIRYLMSTGKTEWESMERYIGGM
ncbi:LYR motif-containing protein 2 [Paramyrothecium foliicola]|nr:LYR motif-containing protein 2 [Paramyrothecium foliicola]